MATRTPRPPNAGLAAILVLVWTSAFAVSLAVVAYTLSEIPAGFRLAACLLGIAAAFGFVWRVAWKTATGISLLKPSGDEGTTGKQRSIWACGVGVVWLLNWVVWTQLVGWSWLKDGYIKAFEAISG